MVEASIFKNEGINGRCAIRVINALANSSNISGFYGTGERFMSPGGKDDQAYLISEWWKFPSKIASRARASTAK